MYKAREELRIWHGPSPPTKRAQGRSYNTWQVETSRENPRDELMHKVGLY